jgi:hypothetical protein
MLAEHRQKMQRLYLLNFVLGVLVLAVAWFFKAAPLLASPRLIDDLSVFYYGEELALSDSESAELKELFASAGCRRSINSHSAYADDAYFQAIFFVNGEQYFICLGDVSFFTRSDRSLEYYIYDPQGLLEKAADVLGLPQSAAAG